jgi:hypothetical protein
VVGVGPPGNGSIQPTQPTSPNPTNPTTTQLKHQPPQRELRDGATTLASVRREGQLALAQDTVAVTAILQVRRARGDALSSCVGVKEATTLKPHPQALISHPPKPTPPKPQNKQAGRVSLDNGGAPVEILYDDDGVATGVRLAAGGAAAGGGKVEAAGGKVLAASR